jgi:hypothetical protein
MIHRLIYQLNRRRRPSSERGAALILAAMAAVVILFAVVVARVELQRLSTSSSLLTRNDLQSREQARSGLEIALQQLRDARGAGTQLTSCRLNALGLPQAQAASYNGPTSDDAITGCATQTGVKGPASMRLGNGCVTWWFGNIDPLAQTIEVHVAAVAPYVPHDNADADSGACNLSALLQADSSSIINVQGGVTYQLTAVVSTWTAAGRPTDAPAGQYAMPACPDVAGPAGVGPNGIVDQYDLPCALTTSYDKRTFNL